MPDHAAVPDGFFDGVYARADGDDTAVPWQHAVSRRLTAEWLSGFDATAHRRALVVAAGLGDDAAALAERGLDVVAFDAAPTAVDWARRRHPAAAVDWHVADLFDLPSEWTGAFDLVIEVFTVQSTAPDRQADAARAIAATVAPGGLLMAVAITLDAGSEPATSGAGGTGGTGGTGPPWPLGPSVVAALTEGVEVLSRHDEQLAPGVIAVRLELRRPDPHPA